MLIESSSKREWIRKHQMENRPLGAEGPNLLPEYFTQIELS
jgi:hypothetical protein